VEELLSRLLELRSARGRGIAVGISGVDCAGKSTLAESLRDRLEEDEVPVLLVSGDAFTRPTAERYAEADLALGYYRDSFAYDWLFEELLPAVRSGFTGELSAAVSDWERDSWRIERFTIAPRAVVIVEGCFLFTAERADAFDLRVWIDLPLEQSVSSARHRQLDLDRMGGPSGVRDRYARRYMPGQQLHLERDTPKRKADVVLAPAGPVGG
jgi:uridine kinase